MDLIFFSPSNFYETLNSVHTSFTSRHHLLTVWETQELILGQELQPMKDKFARSRYDYYCNWLTLANMSWILRFRIEGIEVSWAYIQQSILLLDSPVKCRLKIFGIIGILHLNRTFWLESIEFKCYQNNILEGTVYGEN